MGWSRGMENGREIGYGVDAECDVPSCSAEINRGMAYRCGGTRNFAGEDAGCGAYVCDEHNFFECCPLCDGPDNGDPPWGPDAEAIGRGSDDA